MANFFLTYDLNGPWPTHADVDAHIERLPGEKGRVLESVWYIGGSFTAVQLRNYMNKIFNKEDQILVVECQSAAWRNLKIPDQALLMAWDRNQHRGAA